MELNVVLKCARLILNKRAEENPDGAIKLKVDGKPTKIKIQDLVGELSRLEDLAKTENLRLVETCETCECIEFGKKDVMAQCYPKNYTSWRCKTDTCRFHLKRGEFRR